MCIRDSDGDGASLAHQRAEIRVVLFRIAAALGKARAQAVAPKVGKQEYLSLIHI